jgi:hypothetical protein
VIPGIRSDQLRRAVEHRDLEKKDLRNPEAAIIHVGTSYFKL